MGFNKIHDATNQLANKINAKLEEKFEEALKIWGVDKSNHEEVKARCIVNSFLSNNKKELFIDGNLVMIFTEPEIPPFDFFSDNPIKIEAEFKCSEIMKPINYGA